MSKSIRTKVSTAINNAVYNDNQIRDQLDNMELYDSVNQQLNEIQGLIDSTTNYVNNSAITDLSNLNVDTAALAAQNAILEPMIVSVQAQVDSLEASAITTEKIMINKDSTYRGNMTIVGNVRVNTLTIPALVRIDASGNILPSSGSTLITNADIQVSAGITDTKLGNISAPGKVAVSATTATLNPTPNTILLRDASGYIYGKTHTNITDVSNNHIATAEYVKNAYSTILGNSTETLDTLNELAAALGDDSNYAVNVMNSISEKANIINPVLTGNTVMSNVFVSGMESLSSGILSTNGVGFLGKTSVNTAIAASSIVFPDSNLATLAASGKVQNTALPVSVEPSANTLVVRDASGDLGTTFTNGVLVQNKELLTNPLYSHNAGPYSQGWNKWPMPTKEVVEDATTTWVLRAGANANACTGLCWSPEVGRFVGVGYSRYVVSSRSGITWEEYDSGINNDWNDVVWAYDLSMYVAVASSGTDNRVMTSTNAVNWTPQNTSGLNYNWSAITYSDELNLLVAVGTDASIMTSTDAVSWTLRPYAYANGLRSICWSKELNMFVAPEYNVGGATGVAISYDGTSWTQLPSVLTSATYWSVCWSPERRLFVVVGGTNNIAVSNDGLNWTNQTIANAQGVLQKVVWSQELGVFVAVCSNAANRNLFWVSETGLTWRSVQAPVYPSSETLNSLTLVWSPELSIFCLVTSNGTLQEKVFTSSLSARLVNSSTVFNSPFMSIDNSGNWTIPKISVGSARVNNLFTNGINNTTRPISTADLNLTGNARLGMSVGATPGYTLTSADSTGTSMWLPYKTVPLQINGNITSDSVATWTSSGQTKTLGNISLQPGNWSLYYKTAYAAEPTGGVMDPSGNISTDFPDVSNTNMVFRYGFNEIQGTNFANTASGTPIFDASGFNGAAVNTSDYKVGTGSLDLLDVSSQYVQLPTFTNTTNGITVCFWFKHNNTGAYLSNNGWVRLFDFGIGSGLNDSFGYTPINGVFIFQGSTFVIPANDVPLIQQTTRNIWHFFAWTMPYASGTNTSTHTFYFDGQSTTRNYRHPNILSRTFNIIGKEFPGNSPYYSGLVDDFRFYNRVLSADEINTIYRTYPPITNIIQPFNSYTLKLDGTKYLQLRNYLDFNIIGGTTCTLECWVFPTTYTNTGLIVKSGRYGLYMSNAGLIRVYDWTLLAFTNSSITVPLNTWSHVAVSISSAVASGTTFYYNGVATGSAITYTFGSPTTNPVIIGGEGITKLVGHVSNVRIWNTLRSSGEIGGNYNKLISSATGLIASLYLNDLPTSTRAANNVYPAARTITRSIAGIYSATDISTNAITASQTEDVRNIVFNEVAITGRGVEEVVPITNTSDASATYFLNSYIETNSTFNVGTGRTAGQSYLYAIREPTVDTTFYFKQYVPPINYANFSSTSGLVLLSAATATGGDILLTPASGNQVGNAWTTWNANYDADFKTTFRMNLYSGSATPADGFCIQWNAANNGTGVVGGGCGALTSSKYAIVFKTFTINTIELYENGTLIQSFPAGTSFYADVYYWVDYNYSQKKLNVYRNSTNTKPAAPSYAFTNVNFPSATPYYIGFGAATGGSFQAHALKAFSLEIVSYKLYWILPPITPMNIGIMENGTQLDLIYSGNAYDVYKLNRIAFSNAYLNMNYMNGNYMTYNNNGALYSHYRDASNISFAAATRVYVRGYTGPVVQLRRSTDGALQNFYTDEYQTYLTTLPNGAGTAYSTWVSGATAYVRTWYNQNGNGNNAINTVADTTQPVLALDNGKYVVQWTAASGTFLRIPDPIQPNTVCCEFYNTNVAGSIACYANTVGEAVDYQQRFNNLSVLGLNTSNDWYSASSGTKLAYVDGTPTNGLTAWGSWKTVALSATNPTHNGGGFGFIGKDGANSANSIQGYMSQIVFHNKAMPVGSLIGFHTDRLIV